MNLSSSRSGTWEATGRWCCFRWLGKEALMDAHYAQPSSPPWALEPAQEGECLSPPPAFWSGPPRFSPAHVDQAQLLVG